jgi:hypothetical protein
MGIAKQFSSWLAEVGATPGRVALPVPDHHETIADTLTLTSCHGEITPVDAPPQRRRSSAPDASRGFSSALSTPEHHHGVYGQAPDGWRSRAVGDQSAALFRFLTRGNEKDRRLSS